MFYISTLICVGSIIISCSSSKYGEIEYFTGTDFEKIRETENGSYNWNYEIFQGDVRLGDLRMEVNFQFIKFVNKNKEMYIIGKVVDAIDDSPIVEALIVYGKAKKIGEKININPETQTLTDKKGDFHLRFNLKKNARLYFLYFGYLNIVYNIDKLKQ